MTISVRLSTGILSALPAILFGLCALTYLKGEYYWISYIIMAVIFCLSCFILGLFLPAWIHQGKFDLPWLWLFIAGGFAWLIAILSLGLLNLTPLCIGQDNGDGINDVGLCVFYTILAGLVFSPVALVILIINSVIGGKIITLLIKSSQEPTQLGK